MMISAQLERESGTQSSGRSVLLDFQAFVMHVSTKNDDFNAAGCDGCARESAFHRFEYKMHIIFNADYFECK